MCFTIEQVLFIVCLAILSGSDWEHMARTAIKRKLGIGDMPDPPPTRVAAPPPTTTDNDSNTDSSENTPTHQQQHNRNR